MHRMAITAAAVCGISATLVAQQPVTSFEVASIKPSGRQGVQYLLYPNGTLRITNLTLRSIIAQAYGIGLKATQADLSRFTLVGGPAALLSRSFDIEAKTLPGTDWARAMGMLRTLLADRFKLRIRAEVRRIPIYALTTTGKGFGPRFRRSEVDCVALLAAGQMKDPSPLTKTKCAGGMMTVGVGGNATYAGPLSQLILFAQPFLDRPLIDQTGLHGSFEWTLEFRDDLSTLDRLTVFDAFRRDLGLRIEPRVGPYEVLVIESVEMPTPN